MPKKDYYQYSGIFMTNYGSFDTTFTPIDSDDFLTTPEGVAHFLEHKMFETSDGQDVNDLFSNGDIVHKLDLHLSFVGNVQSSI